MVGEAMARKEKIAARKRTCFVVSPMGEPSSEVRARADWFVEGIVGPAVGRAYNVRRAGGISVAGMIGQQVITQLQEADLVIADMTGMNPNVFYEIGVRHCTDKPIVHMVSRDDVIPFDVKLYRAIVFSLVTPSDIDQAKRDLRAQV